METGHLRLINRGMIVILIPLYNLLLKEKLLIIN